MFVFYEQKRFGISKNQSITKQAIIFAAKACYGDELARKGEGGSGSLLLK
jgi:hypothetical protein